MRLPRLFLVGLLPAASLFFHAEDAGACAAMCASAVLAPAAGSTVPASAPGLPVFGGAASVAGEIELRTAAGDLVPGTIAKDKASSRFLFTPASALAPGEYKSSSPSNCGGGAPVEAAFTVTAAAPIPLITGTLTVKRAIRENTSVTTSSGSCTEPVDAAMVDLDLALDSAVAPYAAIVSWETEVDGNWWFGQNGGTPSTENASLGRSLLRLFTACDGLKPSGRDTGLTPGPHDVSVRAVLTGGATIAPATIRVNVTCDAKNGTIEALGDGVIPGSGSESGPWEGTSGGGGRSPSSTSGSSDASRLRAQDGCAATPLSSSSSSASISTAVIALLGIAGLRRRRSTLD